MGVRMQRTLGKGGIEVSAVDRGCWAIGGVWTFDGNPAGWSSVDEAESVRAIHEALDLGVTFFDTAANYGCGHSERALAAALGNRHSDVVVATKFGHRVDAAAKTFMPYGANEASSDVVPHMRTNLEASLFNLGTDHINLNSTRGVSTLIAARGTRRAGTIRRRGQGPGLRLEHRSAGGRRGVLGRTGVRRGSAAVQHL